MPIDIEMRKTGVPASDVGAICGVDPERDEFSVWAEKKGGLPPSPPNDRQMVGKILEPAVLQLYAYKTGCEIEYCDQTMRHAEKPYMIVTPDAFVKGKRKGVDAKVSSVDQRRHWGATADDIPERIQLQCWYYMAFFGFDTWDVAALLGDGMPRIYTIERDLEAERAMLARVEEFYRRYIAGDEIPPLDGSKSAGVWLQQTFPNHKRPDLRRATPAEEELLATYAAIRIDQAELKADRAVYENAIKFAIGEREGLIWPDGKFTWRKTKDGIKVDYKSLSIGLLNEFVPDAEHREALLAFYTSPKPGVRRIYFDCDLVPTETETEEA